MTALCPDGKTLRVDGSTRALWGPWGFRLRLTAPSGAARLTTGTTGSFEAVERHTGRLAAYTVREVAYRGRPLVSYEDAENATTTFLWRGQNHELSWTTGGKQVSFDPFVALLRVLHLDDSPSGLVVRAKRGTGVSVAMSVAANTLTDLCAITVMPTQDSSVNLPSHAGKKVSGGVMWRTDEVDSRGAVLRTASIANASTLTQLGFFQPNSPANTEIAESLKVSLG